MNGDGRRLAQVSDAEVRLNWERIFQTPERLKHLDRFRTVSGGSGQRSGGWVSGRYYPHVIEDDIEDDIGTAPEQ